MAEALSGVASIATIVAAIAVVVTVFIYHRQLVAMTKSRQLDSLMAIMRYFDDLSLHRARYFMLEHAEALRPMFDRPYSWDVRRDIDARVRELSSDEIDLHNIDLVLNALENICFLVRHNYVPREAIQAFLKNSLLHVWYAFEPYIRHRRTRPNTIGEPSQYAAHLEWVVNQLCRQNHTVSQSPLMKNSPAV